jgi:hypothetical protein
VTTIDATLTEEHLRALRDDHPLYCSAALKIQTKAGRLEPFELNYPQRLVEQRVDEQKRRSGRVRVLILKARQEGISTWVAGRIFKGVTLWGNKRGAVVADKSERAGDIFAIYERYRDHVPPVLIPPKKAAQRAREMWWTTDSRLTVETAGDADVGRGSTIHYLHVSELALWEHADESWTALMQAVTDDAEVYVEFTAKGIGNLAHRLWLQAEAGESDWVAVFLPWFAYEDYRRGVTDAERLEILTSADPWERGALDTGIEWEGELHRLSVEQIAWRRAKIRNDFLGDERAFRQEFPATAREAFVTSGDVFFDADVLLERERLTKPPRWRGMFIKDDRMGWRPQRSERGDVHVWEWPDPHGHYVAFGDTAEGKMRAASNMALNEADAERGGRDYSSLDILKVAERVPDPRREGHWLTVPCLKQVAQIHGHEAPEVFAEQTFAASALWSCPGSPQQRSHRRQALTGIERNHSSGQTVIRVLVEVLGHQNIYRARRMNVAGKHLTSYEGWITDGTTRMPMLDTLAALVRSMESGLEINSAGTVREMFTFVRNMEGRPEAQEGAHDDRVISLAGAIQMSLNHRCGDYHDTAPSAPFNPDSPTGL